MLDGKSVFVNWIATIKGVTLVDYVTNHMSNYVMNAVNTKNKNVNIEVHNVKNRRSFLSLLLLTTLLSILKLRKLWHIVRALSALNVNFQKNFFIKVWSCG